MEAFLIGLLFAVQAPEPCSVSFVVPAGLGCAWGKPPRVTVVQESDHVKIRVSGPPTYTGIECPDRAQPGEGRITSGIVACDPGYTVEYIDVGDPPKWVTWLRRVEGGWRIEAEPPLQ